MKKTAQCLLISLIGLFPTLAGAQTAHFDPDYLTTAPNNVMYGKTLSAAIYPVINLMKIKLAVENPLRIPVRIRLLNDRNQTLFSDRLGRNWRTHMQAFDMQLMKDGTHTLEVSDGVSVLPLEFRVESARKAPVEVPDRVIALN